MQANYDCKMSDEEYEWMMSKIKDDEQKKKLAEALKSGKEKTEGWTFSQYASSDEDVNQADDSFSNHSDASLSLGHGGSDDEILDLFAPGYKNGKALNNSFHGPYHNIGNIHVDKGPNT